MPLLRNAEKTNFGFCTLLSTLLLKIVLVDSGLVNAMQHKDKLLAYDRDLQSKTVVYGARLNATLKINLHLL